ncbi:T9SS type B sorting domain-containing protein [Sphingobacterium sp. SGG-5]|uniref:T9SS type B sorting domain-containing protein n=2 Tax=Sphingobacterium sp. SGG-5 TaxID=2710881 RepID=UPI0013ED5C2E|nr:gliding motility-associated C-terminal domain-containing protein [Sphingobacterium sp. SGG-5]NGM63449.1 T9SS type B sorting domain-containing protein [Sphingobacterium sp. SGG-5]
MIRRLSLPQWCVRTCIALVLCMTACLSAQAQLTVGNGGMVIKPGTLFSVDGLTFNPTEEVSFSGTVIQRSTTPVDYSGSTSVNQVYTFGAPLSYTGTLRFPYTDDMLDGEPAENLKLIFTSADGDPFTIIPETVVDQAKREAKYEFETATVLKQFSALAVDDTPPTGYTIAIDQIEITLVNHTALSFTFSGAEVGTTFDYTVASSGGGAPVTGNGTITTAGQQVAGIDVSGLLNGTLTVAVTLTDPADNVGSPAMDNVTKAVSYPPTITTSGGITIFTEATSGPVMIDNGLTVADPDNTTLSSAEVSITGGFRAGQDILGFTNDGSTMGNIQGSYNAATGALTLTSADASASLAQWQSALRAVTYSNSSLSPSTTTRTVSFTANDGTDNSVMETKSILVLEVNTAPVVTVPAAIAVTEDVPTALTGVSFSDADAGSGQVTATFSVPGGTLTAVSGGGVTVGGTAAALTLTGSIANLNAFIAAGNVGFTTALNATSGVTLTVVINDGGNTGSGGALQDSETVTLQIIAVNDAPVATVPASIAIDEDVQTPLTGISFNDVDAGSGNVTATFSVPSGTLSAISGNGVTVSGPGTATLTLTGSIADLNTFIAASNVGFMTGLHATSNVTLTVTVDDGGNTGSGGSLGDSRTVTLTVTAINDAPVNTIPGGQEVDQNGVLTFSAANGNGIMISDVDAGSNTVEVTLSATNGLLTLSGTAGLTFATGSGTADATMTFTGTIADINVALGGLTFRPNTGYYGAANLQIVTNDMGNSGSGGALTDTDAISITVNPINPEVLEVGTTSADRTYKIGDVITLAVTFNQPVTVDGTGGLPALLLETGAVDREAVYVSGSGTTVLTFSYTVQAGDISADLDYASIASLTLNGSTVRNAAGLDAVLTLPTVGGPNSIGGQRAIVIDGVVPAAPAGVTATFGNGQNVLNWTVNTEGDLRSYKVYGGTSANPATVLATVTAPATTYAHTGLTNGTRYYYRITAVDQAGNESAASTEVSAVPKAPQVITFGALPLKTYGDADFAPGATSTNNTIAITYSSSNETVATIVDGRIHIVGVGTATITASQAGGAAYTPAADVPRTLTVNTKALIITANDQSKIYGNAFAFNGTEFTSQGLVNGDAVTSVTLTSAGASASADVDIYDITASAAQGPKVGNYDISYVSGTLTVNKAPQTITFTDPGTLYRDAGTIDLDVSSSSGLPVNLTIDDDMIATVNSTALTMTVKRLGTVTITAKQEGNPNYLPADPVSVTVRIANDEGAALPVRVHQAVSPNGDGINDFLMIEGVRDYPENKVTIFDKSGKVMAEIEEYDNRNNVFPGGRTVRDGTYYYYLDIRDGGTWKREKGFFIVRRQ